MSKRGGGKNVKRHLFYMRTDLGKMTNLLRKSLSYIPDNYFFQKLTEEASSNTEQENYSQEISKLEAQVIYDNFWTVLRIHFDADHPDLYSGSAMEKNLSGSKS